VVEGQNGGEETANGGKAFHDHHAFSKLLL
jgi:hypothetical protein